MSDYLEIPTKLLWGFRPLLHRTSSDLLYYEAPPENEFFTCSGMLSYQSEPSDLGTLDCKLRCLRLLICAEAHSTE